MILCHTKEFEIHKKNNNIIVFILKAHYANPIQDGWDGGGGQKGSPTSFSPVTSTNISSGQPPKSFWLLVLTLLSHWCKFSSLYLVPVPNY